MGSSRLVPGIYNKGPNDNLVVKDVTRQSVLDTTNNYNDTNAIEQAASNYFKTANVSSRSILGAIGQSTTSGAGGVGLDEGTLKKRLGQLFGVPVDMKDLAGNDKNKILNAVGGATGERGLATSVNGVQSMVTGKSPTSASSLVSLINTAAGDKGLMDLMDLGAQAGFIRGVTGFLLTTGAISVIDVLINKIKDARQKNKMLEETALAAARQGNIANCRHYCDQMKHDRAWRIRDALISALVAAYKIASTETRSMSDCGQEMLDFFAWLDPNWDKDPIDQTLPCLNYYMKAGSDCTKILSYTDRHDYAAAGPLVKLLDIDAVNKISFPKIITW